MASGTRHATRLHKPTSITQHQRLKTVQQRYICDRQEVVDRQRRKGTEGTLPHLESKEEEGHPRTEPLTLDTCSLIPGAPFPVPRLEWEKVESELTRLALKSTMENSRAVTEDTGWAKRYVSVGTSDRVEICTWFHKWVSNANLRPILRSLGMEKWTLSRIRAHLTEEQKERKIQETCVLLRILAEFGKDPMDHEKQGQLMELLSLFHPSHTDSSAGPHWICSEPNIMASVLEVMSRYAVQTCFGDGLGPLTLVPILEHIMDHVKWIPPHFFSADCPPSEYWTSQAAGYLLVIVAELMSSLTHGTERCAAVLNSKLGHLFVPWAVAFVEKQQAEPTLWKPDLVRFELFWRLLATASSMNGPEFFRHTLDPRRNQQVVYWSELAQRALPIGEGKEEEKKTDSSSSSSSVSRAAVSLGEEKKESKPLHDVWAARTSTVETEEKEEEEDVYYPSSSEEDEEEEEEENEGDEEEEEEEEDGHRRIPCVPLDGEEKSLVRISSPPKGTEIEVKFGTDLITIMELCWSNEPREGTLAARVMEYMLFVLYHIISEPTWLPLVASSWMLERVMNVKMDFLDETHTFQCNRQKVYCCAAAIHSIPVYSDRTMGKFVLTYLLQRGVDSFLAQSLSWSKPDMKLLILESLRRLHHDITRGECLDHPEDVTRISDCLSSSPSSSDPIDELASDLLLGLKCLEK